MFYYVYILLCSDDRLYIGYSRNLKLRIDRHTKGLIPATKPRLPVELIFYEAYRDKYDALRREKYLKSTKGKQSLRAMLSEFFAKL